MSADAWEICPSCERDRQEAIRIADNLVTQAYGTVPVDEFHDLEARLANMRSTAPEHTLREDYEMFIQDGEFRAHFTAACSKCNWSHHYEYREPIQLTAQSRG